MMNRLNRSDRSYGTKRKYKSGHLVQVEGLYNDEWGGALLLLQGDVFPVHPHMGDTSWTYAGPFGESRHRAPQRKDHWVTAGGAGFLK